MDTSQFMDKQIMDLTSSPLKHSSSISDKDHSIDLTPDHRQENDSHQPQQQQQQSSLYDINSIISGGGDGGGDGDGDIGIKKDEMVASYDFQPIRPVVSNSLGYSSTVARVLNSADSKSNSSAFPLRNYGSLDSIEPVTVIAENDRNAVDSGTISEIDQTMKKYTDNLLHILEGVSARLTQLESRSHHLEIIVEDLKVSIGNSHANTDGKVGQVEKVLTKLQAGVEVIKDKHELFEAQLKLAGLLVSGADQKQSEFQNSGHMDTIQQAASAPPQSHQPLPPVTFPQSVPPVPGLSSAVPPLPISQLNFPLPIQFSQSQIPPIPQKESYYSSLGQTQEPSNPQYQINPQPPQSSTAVPPHQPYEPAAQPPYSQPTQLSQPQSSVGHHPVEAPYISSQSYPSSLHQPSSQSPTGAQRYFGAPSNVFDQPSSRPSSGFSTGYGPPSALAESYPSGGKPPQYGSNTTMKPLFSPALSQSSVRGYPQLPTARALPHALPTASGIGGGGSGSSGTGNRVPIDDVVEKVGNMGFPREIVRATVKKMTEKGQSVDLNTVLDKLMNDGEVQPQRGWFGR